MVFKKLDFFSALAEGMSLRYGVALYGGVGGKEKNSHRFFGIFIRLNLCEINGLLFEPCLAFSNI